MNSLRGKSVLNAVAGQGIGRGSAIASAAADAKQAWKTFSQICLLSGVPSSTKNRPWLSLDFPSVDAAQ